MAGAPRTVASVTNADPVEPAVANGRIAGTKSTLAGKAPGCVAGASVSHSAKLVGSNRRNADGHEVRGKRV
jgi:hypothetical protein